MLKLQREQFERECVEFPFVAAGIGYEPAQARGEL